MTHSVSKRTIWLNQPDSGGAMAGLFDRSEEHTMLGETLRRFIRDHSTLEERGRRLRAQPPMRLGLWSALSELGALGAAVPEHSGGFGGSMRDIAVVQDALAPGLIVEPFLTTAMSARLLSHASRDDVTALLEALVRGHRIPVVAHAEGFEPFAEPDATVTDTKEGLRLQARKPCVRHADVATDFLVTARMPDGRVVALLVPRDAPGLTLVSTRLIDGAGAGDLLAHDVALPHTALIDFGGSAMPAVADALECGLAGLCAEVASLTEVANRETYAYLNMREQFGDRLGQFQVLQHRAADMAIAQEEAAATAEMAVACMENAPTAARTQAVLAASLACDAAGRRVGHGAVQLFGGMGVSDELAISHYARRLAAIRGQIGTTEARAARLCALEADAA